MKLLRRHPSHFTWWKESLLLFEEVFWPQGLMTVNWEKLQMKTLTSWLWVGWSLLKGVTFPRPPISNSSGSNRVTIVHPASALSFENDQWLSSVQFSSVAQSCPTLCDPTNCSTPGLPVHHQLPEFTQTHVHRVSDAIQPSHPLSSPSPPAPNPSQHQSLFQWVNSSHEVAKVLEFQL